MKKIALSLVFAMFLAPGFAQAQSTARKDIVGTWKLVKDVNKAADGTVRSQYGDKPMGQITFLPDGRYHSLLMRADVPKFAAGARDKATADEAQAVVRGSIGTFGKYSVSEDGKTMSVQIEASTYPNWIGQEQKRPLMVAGDTMSYQVNASIGGVTELTFQRVK